ncbi:MAG: aldo/keto reductase [Anaerolineales bacterium]
MQYKHLGRTGLKVSRLCLGTMNFGPLTAEADSFRIMDRALEEGINFFDTANVYGWKTGEGVTEQIVGRWFGQGGGRREKVVIATKVFGNMGDWPNQERLSALNIRQASNFAAWDIAQANSMAKARNFLGLVSEQSLYNLSARMIELEVIPACRAFGLGIIPWSPLAGGMLGGALQKAKEGRRAEERRQKDIEKRRPQLEAWEKFCGELGEQPADVALAWLLANPDVTGPIIGPRTMDQLTGALHALEIKLDEGIMKKMDDIWPGPGGEAPKAYAW